MSDKRLKILLVDDQVTSALFVATGLRDKGFIVDIASTGPDGLNCLLANDYALAILDVMLPGIDGWTILEKAREAGRNIPVLFLTAKDEVADRVKGLELGADDYLVKPFAFPELLARVKVIMRRHSMKESSSTELAVADLRLDLLSHKAIRGDLEVELTPKEFALLSIFMRNRGKVLSRSLLAEEVWGMDFETNTNVVDVAVRRLRTKIDEGHDRKFIHTQRGTGYVFEERE